MYSELAKRPLSKDRRTNPGSPKKGPLGTVTLTIIEQRLARTLARAWTEYDNTIDYPGTISGLDDLTNNTNAIGAELAFCRIHNIYPNLNLNGFERHDCTLPDGTKVDVKYSPHENPNYHLIVQIKNYKKYPDVYALMTGTWPIYHYWGYVPKKDIIRPERINNNLPVPAYAYPRKELHVSEVVSPDELKITNWKIMTGEIDYE